MKRIFAFVLFCFCLMLPSVNFAMAEDNTPIFVTTANSANVYVLPNFSSDVVTTLSYNSEIYLEIEANSPKTYENGGFIFYKVIGENEGYIFADLVMPKSEVVTAIPNYNGRTNAECTVFFLQENEMIESEITLSKNQRIFIYKAFDSKAEYTAIAFEHENKVMYGYVQTKFVAPDGINPVIITCVVLILALIGIIFAWVFMKNSKIKK
ncbi:MAG: hypothetical protein ACI4R8_00280 [Candidatus Caccovivens sp.]